MTDYLDRALALADATLGRAHPKPDVGAVLVRDGRIVGEGSTEAGGRHGEIVALDAAGAVSGGATLYVLRPPRRNAAVRRRDRGGPRGAGCRRIA